MEVIIGFIFHIEMLTHMLLIELYSITIFMGFLIYYIQS
jgi:hypothetical protein